MPPEMANDPKTIVQYLLNTGRMTQEQFNSLYNTVRQGGY